MPRKVQDMDAAALPQPAIRRKPGRPRVPGRMTVDTKTGKMGIFLCNCEHGWPVILTSREFDQFVKVGTKTKRAWTTRFIMHVLAFKDI